MFSQDDDENGPSLNCNETYVPMPFSIEFHVLLYGQWKLLQIANLLLYSDIDQAFVDLIWNKSTHVSVFCMRLNILQDLSLQTFGQDKNISFSKE